MNKFIETIFSKPELIIAFIALVTSAVSILIGLIGLQIQRNHNKKSVLPIGTINLADYEDSIKIRISNNGVGPLIIKSCSTRSSNKSKGYPIDWMPIKIIFDTFRKGLENHAIVPGASLTLLEKKINFKKEKQIKELDDIRSILKNLELELEFTDIYKKNFKTRRKLDWFGRNLKKIE